MHTVILPKENLVGQLTSTLLPEATQCHLYCPVCGEVWAHCISSHPLSQHQYIPQRCAIHHNGSLAPFFSYLSMPEEFLRREAILHFHPLRLPSGLTYFQANMNEP